jgi:hypothetical protein
MLESKEMRRRVLIMPIMPGVDSVAVTWADYLPTAIRRETEVGASSDVAQ